MYILRRVAKFVSYQYTGQTRPQKVKSVMIMAQFPYGQKWDMSPLELRKIKFIMLTYN